MSVIQQQLLAIYCHECTYFLGPKQASASHTCAAIDDVLARVLVHVLRLLKICNSGQCILQVEILV